MYTIPLPETKVNQHTRSRIGEAVYLLAYLIRACNWETGRLRTTHRKIAEDTGFPETTVKRWMQTLADEKEITTRRTSEGTLVTINDYQSIARTRGVKYKPSAPAEADGPRAVSSVSPAKPKTDPDARPAGSEKTENGPYSGPLADLRWTGGDLSNIKGIMDQKRTPSTLQSPSSQSLGVSEAPACGLRDQTPPRVGPGPESESRTAAPESNCGASNPGSDSDGANRAFQCGGSVVASDSGGSAPASESRTSNPASDCGRPKTETGPRRSAERKDLFDYSDPWKEKLAAARAALDAMSEEDRRALMQQAMAAMETDRRPFVRIFVRRDDSGTLVPRGPLAEEMILRTIAQMLENAERAAAACGTIGTL